MFWKKKKKVTSFECSKCGVVHDVWPALTYAAPSAYHSLTDYEKNTIGKLNADFCIIDYPDQTDRFIRVTLYQKVIDHWDTLDYGLWVSLSKQSFEDYSKNFKNEQHQVQYFGWLSSTLSQYDFSESIPVTVHTQKGNQRPEIIPHQDFYHPFVNDYYKGISKQEAEQRIHSMLDAL